MLLLFAAPASEIDAWSGVPQKKSFEIGSETTGFQREANPKRIEDLTKFFSNSENIVQNPILCATRSVDGANTAT